ncbi:alpha-1,6-mannosylglycoprotein 6-beta-N-acetylglucosaminyltransferase A-like [Tubulanus polymorphus]|uniref:alpha-1,6-mannosylglycoprotein 6-beta-N-acetylglucosaminyltransferase A-like n=1 Tax=Tubulanus polymorphus TaxID=672921 RepID=UPI003DA2AB8E
MSKWCHLCRAVTPRLLLIRARKLTVICAIVCWIVTFISVIRLQTFQEHDKIALEAKEEIHEGEVSYTREITLLQLGAMSSAKWDQPYGNNFTDPRGVDVSKCVVTRIDDMYPHCDAKFQWMRLHWKSDTCYGENGVDGSDCSFLRYLSEVENWCPHLPGRQTVMANKSHADSKWHKKASLRLEIEPLMSLLKDPVSAHKNYDWMRLRIRRMWPNWAAAAENLGRKQDLQNRRQMKVFMHLGLLTRQAGLKFAESAFKGGPLGELVQWSDLITALYILGHNLTISSEIEQLSGYIMKYKYGAHTCPPPSEDRLDLLYTDILGLKQIKRYNKKQYTFLRCALRVLDSFGTEPQFNYDMYAKKHRLKSDWGKHNLLPKQFNTMFPHTPDNTFLGFVVERPPNNSRINSIARRNRALVYGKNDYMWYGKAGYLNIVKDYSEIHGTVARGRKGKNDVANVPKYVKNHGILVGEELTVLLHTSKLFLGLGFPYEGPAPLEAIANGAAFINPRFNPPHGSRNTDFFKGKPTQRELTSQHPYAEQYIGEPFVYTVDINNAAEVRKAVEKALQCSKGESFLPYEFTEEGMLQRINSFINNQNFCDSNSPLWPPQRDVNIYLAIEGVSCKDTCSAKGLICEPTHFKRINSAAYLAQLGIHCQRKNRMEGLIYPAIDRRSQMCTFQSQELLFSCVGSTENYARICPCRNYMKGQTALCHRCL